MNNTTATKSTCGHPMSDDELTCVFFAQCSGNSDIELYRSTFATALENTGSATTARRCAEAYMAGRIGSLPTYVR